MQPDKTGITSERDSPAPEHVRPAPTSAAMVRKLSSQQTVNFQNLSRRRFGALLMSAIAIGSMFFRRLNYDLPAMMLLELFMGASVVGLLAWLTIVNSQQKTKLHSSQSRAKPWQLPLMLTVLLIPWLVDFVGRTLGGGNGREIQMLGSLAWGSLASAVVASTSRSISISVICSGFLTLFATFISDSGQATYFAYAWGILCLWWLVSNHWESIECQSAVQVRSSGKYRILSLTIGCLIFSTATLLFSNRIPVLRKLKSELMPTSGGTTARDSVGRGVGNGDSLIAARNHPTSFGAVESDIFLESTKPSLFDLAGEEMGWPKLNRRHERAQALNSEQNKAKAGNFSEANQASGGSDFSTAREAPKLREKPNNIVGESLMFWAGKPAAHLAVERFSFFDGVHWSNSNSDTLANSADNGGQIGASLSVNPANATVPISRTISTNPLSIDIDGQTWMYASESSFPNEASPFVDAMAESLKFTRFRSHVIPARASLQMWSIHLLDRADFFSVDSQSVVSMPGREHVPDYTVVRMVNGQIDRQRVEELLSTSFRHSVASKLPDECQNQIDLLVAQWTTGIPRGLEQVEAVIEGLRRDFQFDRQWSAEINGEDTSPGAIPLQQFLENRRGPSYLFATAATQLLGRLGYKTRLATGFYANAKHFLSAEREIGILPEDTHVWLELNVGHNYWIPLEPTPGYHAEPLSVSWWYQLKKARYAIAKYVLASAFIALLAFTFRGFLLESLCWAAWPLTALMSDRSRVVWLARLLDLRSRLAGMPRQKSRALREHMRRLSPTLSAELHQTIDQFCRAADRLCFGGATSLSRSEQQAIRQVWRRLTYFQIRHCRQISVTAPDVGSPS